MTLLRDKHILLGITGGIAAYKAPQLVRELTRAGARVRAVLTDSARQFVSPLTLQVLTGTQVGTDLFDPQYEQQIGHIELARWADAVLVAPATANTLGKLANGLADDLLSTILLATTAPVVLAPSMNTKMLEHPMVADNIQRLRDRLGAHVVAPDEGELACLETGAGRLPDPDVLIDALRAAISPKSLAGRRVLVTLGPTRERIDAVRFLTNGSSGRMGFAICRAARDLGAEVVAVTGPTSASAPWGLTRIEVETALEMHDAVLQQVDAGTDVAVFTAAVADIRPRERRRNKVPKGEIGLELALERNPDILKTVAARQDRPFCVGFAAETGDIEAKTVAKCANKGCDLMIGNDVATGLGFGTDDNAVVVTNADRVLERFGPDSKLAIATQIWSLIVGHL